MTKTHFPKDFLWGTATAAHQIEGNNVNCDLWSLEHMTGSFFKEPSGDAIDHFRRYPEDIALLADLGFNSYRFSIEWTRVEPEDGFLSVATIDHYRRMLETCQENNLTTIVTSHHFTTPCWVIRQGGWENPETDEKFARYCARVTQNLGDLIGAVCTINKINISKMFANMFSKRQEAGHQYNEMITQAAALFGVSPESFSPFFLAGTPSGTEVLLSAYKHGAKAIRSERGDLPVGLTIAMQDMQTIEGGEETRDKFRGEIQDIWLDAARNDDFVGVQTYSRERFGPEGPIGPEEGVELTQMGYEFWPEALEATLLYADKIAGVPLIVTENGIATEDDTGRIEYYQRAIACVSKLRAGGLDIRGYFAWSAFDNVEWMLGYGPKFGIIDVERDTQVRSVKPNGCMLGKIAHVNQFQLN